MLLPSSRISNRVRCAGSLSLKESTIRGTFALQHRQIRDFRFGRTWTYSYDGGPKGASVYHRHRCFRYKYTETLNRGADGAREPLAEDPKAAVKRIVYDYWQPGPKDNRYQASVFSAKTSENPEGIRPGQNIEDAERAPLEDLLFGTYKSVAFQGAGAASDLESGYNIDPITNRKVPKPDRHAHDSKARSESLSAAAIPRQPVLESEQYVADLNDTPRANLFETLNSVHKNVVWHEADGIAPSLGPSPTVQYERHPAPQYADLDQYGPIGLGVRTESQSGSQVYEDLGDYHASKYVEGDESCERTESVQEYKDLDKYGAFRSHEPDGKYKGTEESSVDPQELSQYKAFRSHEPDGKYALRYAEPVIDQAELDHYSRPFLSHEPDGKYAEAYRESPTDETEVSSYQAFRSHEPDGKYAESYREPSTDEAELSGYEAFRSHEPDGKYAETYREPSTDRAELPSYQAFRSHEPDGKYAETYRELSTDEGELSGYEAFRSHEPDGKYAAGGNLNQPTGELGSYKAFRSHEPDGKYSGKDDCRDVEQAELGQYQAVRSHEPDGKYAEEAKADLEASDLANHEAFGYEDSETGVLSTEDRKSVASNELGKYNAFRHNEPNGLHKVDAEQETYDAEELSKYNPVRWNEPDGRPTGQDIETPSLFEYDAKKASSESSSVEQAHYRKMLDAFMAQSAAMSDAADADARSTLKQKRLELSGQTGSLTGNYARDFPEEFTKSWMASKSGSSGSLRPSDLQPSGLMTASKKEDSVVAKPAGVLEPALNRHHVARDQADRSLSSGPAVPTLYKILVYDPTMQCIDSAETTSVVADSAASLTPAEVLLRISNPSKFLPHFGPLQAQGFEIVSGAGDVLIFRKVRGAADPMQPEGKIAPTHAMDPVVTESTTTRPAVNPIDMTGGLREYTVAAGRFASPTGFVNYDLPPPRYEAGMDVARERPTVSEPKEQPNKEDKKNLPKRLAIGAAWVAGLSYSLGVVGEYFRTGGQNGQGPKGL